MLQQRLVWLQQPHPKVTNYLCSLNVTPFITFTVESREAGVFTPSQLCPSDLEAILSLVPPATNLSVCYVF